MLVETALLVRPASRQRARGDVRHDTFEAAVSSPHEALSASRAYVFLGTVARDPALVPL